MKYVSIYRVHINDIDSPLLFELSIPSHENSPLFFEVYFRASDFPTISAHDFYDVTVVQPGSDGKILIPESAIHSLGDGYIGVLQLIPGH